MSKTNHDHPVWIVLDDIQKELRALQAKVVELRSYVAQLPIPDPKASLCPECGIKFRSALVMSEHLYNSHNGPVPAHYLAAERAAGVFEATGAAVSLSEPSA